MGHEESTDITSFSSLTSRIDSFEYSQASKLVKHVCRLQVSHNCLECTSQLTGTREINGLPGALVEELLVAVAGSAC